MSDNILSTKLYRPPLPPNAVLRTHLIDKLNSGLHRKLSLVSAPAGFGKTTLVSTWADQCNRPVAWLSLDEGDSNPVQFLTYLVAALRTVYTGIGESVISGLRSSQPASTESMLMTLVNELAQRPEPFMLVLDDYHAVESPTIDDALLLLLEHQPAPFHLVIATREDPGIPFARLRAGGQLTELRAADLRFTASEAAEFLNSAMGLDLTLEDVSALESRTEGWIAGLQLAALSMQGHSDIRTFIESFTGSHRFVLDYLVEEVLHRQPVRVRQFLLETSILNRLSGPLCDAVTGRKDGQVMLENLERGNLFIIPLDDRRHWYRYHHLFADMLQMRAIQEQPDELAAWHRRACDWYEQHGMQAETIRHALLGKDFERAAAVLERVANEMLLSRQEETFLAWLAEVPGEVVRVRPVLSAYYSLALVSFDLDAAEAPLRDVEQYLEVASDNARHSDVDSNKYVIVDEEGQRLMPGLVNIIRAYQSGARGNVAGIVEYAQLALDRLSEDQYLWRGAVASLLGLAYWSNSDLEAAHRSFVDGIALLRKSGDVTQSFSLASIVSNIRIAQGRLRDAERTYEKALKLVTEQGEPLSPPAVDLYVGMSELSRERNDLETAKRHLQKTIEFGQHGGISEYRHRWFIAMAMISVAEGDLEQALDLLDKAERLFIPSPDPVVRPIAALKARVWIRQGRLDDTWEWARDRDLAVDGDLSYLREFEHITLARLLIADFSRNRDERSVRDSLRLLGRLRTEAEKGGRIGSLIEILILEALAYEARQQTSRAVGSLERALELAEPEGYQRIFLDEGSTMTRLLSDVSERGTFATYARGLLSDFDRDDAAREDESHQAPALPEKALIEPLSPRELEVLRLVSQGLSNREISERLFVALNTVKGHNRAIFSKLQVARRTEAVARAREFGLL